MYEIVGASALYISFKQTRKLKLGVCIPIEGDKHNLYNIVTLVVL